MMIGLIDSVSLGIAGCFFPTKLGMEDEGRIDVMHTHTGNVSGRLST